MASVIGIENRRKFGLPPFRVGVVVDSFPVPNSWLVSAYQRDLLAVAARHPDLPVVQAAMFSHLDGALDRDRMQACIQALLRRHVAARLRFTFGGDELRQQLSDEMPELEVVDLSGEPDPGAACEAWMYAAGRRVLPADGPMLHYAALLDGPDSFYLFVRVHHALFDAWSMNVVGAQLISDYESGVATDALPNFEMPSYLDFVERANAYRESPRWREDRDFFVDYLAGYEPALFARKRAAAGAERARHVVRLDGALLAQVRAQPMSRFALLTAALATYLSVAHGTRDVVFGIPMLNRSPADMFTAGNFVNMVPLRVRLEPGATLLAVAAAVARDVRELKQREGFSYGDLIRALQDNGWSGIPTLFDVTFSYNKMPASAPLQRLLDRSHTISSGSTLDAVNISAVEVAGGDHVEFEIFSSTDVFDTDLPVEFAVSAVSAILRAGLHHPDTALDQLDWLPAHDRDALAGYESGPAVDYPDTTVDRLFVARADAHPDEPAIRHDDDVLTYRQLNFQAGHLAADLHKRGVSADEPVAVLVPRSPDLFAAIYGVLRAGAAYVPVDPGYPGERIATVLSESGARFAIAGPDVALPGNVTRVPVRHTGREVLAPLSRPEQLAYVIFTSGSTGRPKGAMIEHRSVVNRLGWMQRRYPLTADDVILHKTPFTFDVSVWELFWWSTIGASVALAPAGAERDPRRLVEVIAAHGVTVLHFVPSMLGPFLAELERDPSVLQRISSLRRVFCSGEALPAALVTQFHRALAGMAQPPQLVNLYGPTEATVDVSYFDCPAGTDLAVVPIGTPIDNVSLLVLDEAGRRVPLGVPGELNIAGVQLARGYLGRPDLTAAAFVDDAGVPGGRRYRTGDVARWRADGTIEYLGRRDDQVKVRGNRVTLGEIHNQILACPGVSAAAVVDFPSDNHGTHLVGYVAGDVDVEVVAQFLHDRLPAYMVPSRFVSVDSIPLTANGKADRRALAAHHAAVTTAAAPSTPAEIALAEITAHVLGIESIGVHDNFFTHGGDSILALALRTAAESRGLYIDVDRLFEEPTIAALAAHASDHPRADPNRVSARMQTLALVDRAALHDAVDAFPVTSLQLGMLFHAIERRDSVLYRDVFRYCLEMPWQQAEFTDAVARLVARQPALRSRFDLTEYAEPLQIVQSEVTGVLSVCDDATEADIATYLDERAHFPYAVDTPGLFHLRAFVRGGRVDLVLNFHHAILDGWSVAHLMRELLQDYLQHIGFAVPAVPQTPRSTTVLAEYANAERRAVADAQTRDYWREVLDGATATALPSLLGHLAAAPVRRRPSARYPVPEAVRAAIAQLSAEREVPLKACYLAAHCLTLQHLSGSDDVTTGVVGHGRPARADAEATAGLFLNTLPMRLRRARSWLDAAQQVARAEHAGYPYRRYPLRAMIADRAAAQGVGVHGLSVFETAFNYVHYHVYSGLAAVDGVALLDLEVREETNFGLLVSVLTDPRDGRVSVHVDGDESVTEDQCEQYAATLVRVLAVLAERPDTAVDFGIARVVANDVGTRVADRCALAPAATALVSDAARWTYGELGARVGAIAARLQAAGVRTQDRVGVLMARSPEQIATVVAIAQLGAVCVPLDVQYPRPRITAMLERAIPRCVVADAPYADLVAEPAAVLDAAVVTAPPSGETPALPPALHPDAAAYVLFTSGSTGEPKGVVLPHRALTNLIEWQHRTGTGQVDGPTLQFAPLSFDVAFQEIFATLGTGGTLRLASSTQRADMVALLRTVRDDRIARLYLPFVALQAFAETAVARQEFPADLRVLISSGEQLRSTAQIRQLAANVPGLVVENQYGPTETHVALHHAMIGALPELPPIGRPIDNAVVLLLDAALRPVRDGVEGEIYLGGPVVATGYERRPGLTAARFVPVAPDGGRAYRTGDLGIRLPSGDVVCRGRADAQAKVRGFRVEPAEVELCIAAMNFPGVDEVAVVVRRFGDTDGVLTAFLVGDDTAVTTETLASRLRAELPAYLVPSRFAWLAELPRTPSGKRDDAALRALPLAPTTRGAVIAPRDEYERAVAEVLAEYAGVPEIGVTESFFDAGGTSVGAMRAVLQFNRMWDLELPLESFVTDPTAAGLAALVRDGGPRKEFDPVVVLNAGNLAQGAAPLVLVHPIGGNVLCYLPLLAHLPAELPVLGLQAAGSAPGDEPLRTVPELAASYLAAVRRVYPQGPMHLAGWSFGGYVAYAMSCQLEPEAVRSTTLLDTIALQPGARPTVPESSLIHWFFMELLWYARGEKIVEFAVDTSGAESDDAVFDTILAETIAAGILPAESPRQAIRRLYEIFRANYDATLDYQVDRFDGPVTLLRAADPLPPGVDIAHATVGTMFDSATNGWDNFVRGKLDVITVPGDHLRIMNEPHVGVVAKEIQTAVRRTESA